MTIYSSGPSVVPVTATRYSCDPSVVPAITARYSSGPSIVPVITTEFNNRPDIVPVRVSQKHRHYSSNRYYSGYCHYWLFPFAVYKKYSSGPSIVPVTPTRYSSDPSVVPAITARYSSGPSVVPVITTRYSNRPAIVPVRVSQKHQHYIGNRYYSGYCHYWLFPSAVYKRFYRHCCCSGQPALFNRRNRGTSTTVIGDV